MKNNVIKDFLAGNVQLFFSGQWYKYHYYTVDCTPLSFLPKDKRYYISGHIKICGAGYSAPIYVW